jgi:hypothetical protein
MGIPVLGADVVDPDPTLDLGGLHEAHGCESSMEGEARAEHDHASSRPPKYDCTYRQCCSSQAILVAQ